MKLFAVIFTAFLFTASFDAFTKPIKSLVFNDYGPVYKIAERSVKLPENFIYKAVFDVKTSGQSPTDLSRRLESVARFMNMHALNGVAVKNMALAVVVHGKATKDLLSQSAYQKKYGYDNPNMDLIEQLRSKGVKFYLCGQSMMFSGYQKADLEHSEDLALSAMTMLVVLQQQDYQLLP